MPFFAFHSSISSRNDLSDFATAWFLSTASSVPETKTHCVWATAIVQGVLQQDTVIRASNMLGRITRLGSAYLTQVGLEHNTNFPILFCAKLSALRDPPLACLVVGRLPNPKALRLSMEGLSDQHW